MCVVVSKPAGVARPTDNEFKNMCQRNPDGFGMATFEDGKIIVKKTMDVKEYLGWVSQVKDETPAIFHMRIATHGSVQKKNCHPFLSENKQWAFAHNGILSIQNEEDKTDSETFFRRIAMKFIESGYTPGSKAFDYMIDTVIGSSKFVFMDACGNLYTYGKFVQHNGLLFSNTSYEEPIPSMYCGFGYGSSRTTAGTLLGGLEEHQPTYSSSAYYDCVEMVCDDIMYNQSYYGKKFSKKMTKKLVKQYQEEYNGWMSPDDIEAAVREAIDWCCFDDDEKVF